MGDTVIIEFNQEDLNEYISEWKKKYPRKRKIPIEKPIVRSLNTMLVITNRIVQNTHKQNYKEYAIWTAKKYGFDMIGIKSADLEVNYTFPTKGRRDLDNYTTKEVMDGLSDCGVIIDDSYFYVKSIKTTASYEKGITKMVFTFKNCTFDKEELKVVMEKERIRKEKKDKTMSDKKKSKAKKIKKK